MFGPTAIDESFFDTPNTDKNRLIFHINFTFVLSLSVRNDFGTNFLVGSCLGGKANETQRQVRRQF